MKLKSVKDIANIPDELIRDSASPQKGKRLLFASRVGKSFQKGCGKLTQIIRVPRRENKLNQKGSGHNDDKWGTFCCLEAPDDPDNFIGAWKTDPIIAEVHVIDKSNPTTQTEEQLSEGQNKCQNFVSVDVEQLFHNDEVSEPILEEKVPFIGEKKNPISGPVLPKATKNKPKANKKKARCAQTVQPDVKKCFTQGASFYTVCAIALLAIAFFLVMILNHNLLYMPETVPVPHEGKTSISFGSSEKGIDHNDKKVGSNNKAEIVFAPPEILIRLNAFRKFHIEEPQMLSNIPDSPDGIYLSIFPVEYQNWENTKFPSNVHAVEFGGYLNPKNVKDILKELSSFPLTHIKFSFDNIICDEFSDYNASNLGPKVDLTSLRGVHFEGGGNCGEILEFVMHELLVQNVQLLKFNGTDVFHNNYGLITGIIELFHNTLEYVYMTGVTICSECKLFGNFNLPCLKLGEFYFKSGINSPEVADTINRFNSEIPGQCWSIYPDLYTLRVEC